MSDIDEFVAQFSLAASGKLQSVDVPGWKTIYYRAPNLIEYAEINKAIRDEGEAGLAKALEIMCLREDGSKMFAGQTARLKREIRPDIMIWIFSQMGVNYEKKT